MWGLLSHRVGRVTVCERARKFHADTQEDRPVREPGEGEVQVAMGVTGLCGSDRECRK